jgi:hypothetical protein
MMAQERNFVKIMLFLSRKLGDLEFLPTFVLDSI